jgi:hypothetical protein
MGPSLEENATKTLARFVYKFTRVIVAVLTFLEQSP